MKTWMLSLVLVMGLSTAVLSEQPAAPQPPVIVPPSTQQDTPFPDPGPTSVRGLSPADSEFMRLLGIQGLREAAEGGPRKRNGGPTLLDPKSSDLRTPLEKAAFKALEDGVREARALDLKAEMENKSCRLSDLKEIGPIKVYEPYSKEKPAYAFSLKTIQALDRLKENFKEESDEQAWKQTDFVAEMRAPLKALVSKKRSKAVPVPLERAMGEVKSELAIVRADYDKLLERVIARCSSINLAGWPVLGVPAPADLKALQESCAEVQAADFLEKNYRLTHCSILARINELLKRVQPLAAQIDQRKFEELSKPNPATAPGNSNAHKLMPATSGGRRPLGIAPAGTNNQLPAAPRN